MSNSAKTLFSVVGILALSVIISPTGPVSHETTFVDKIPPEEFLTGSQDRQPSNNATNAADVLASGKIFANLSRTEKRSLYNAVMYFCNENRDDRACKSYVSYCGKACQPLVQGPLAR